MSQDKKDNKKVFCIGCCCELDINHVGIKCQNNHDICVDCSPSFIDTIMENPQANIPIKCMMCSSDIISQTFEMQLSSDQLGIYIKYCQLQQISENEMILNCPFCTYYFITFKTHTMNFIYCQKCYKNSCSVCSKEIPSFENNYDINEREEQEIEKHFKCWEFRELKDEFDQNLEKGMKMFCPSCDLKGVKDDACNHITCVKCQTEWCYFCGKSKAELKVDNFYSHFEDFNKNENRCPMYLYQINDIDNRWPLNNKQCLNFFHQKRSIKNLRQFINKIGKNKYLELVKVFNTCGEACGYSYETIMNEDITLFIRQ